MRMLSILLKHSRPPMKLTSSLSCMLQINHICHILSVPFIDLCATRITTGSLLTKYGTGFRFSEAEARAVAKQLFSALTHIHAQGVVHGDIAVRLQLIDHSFYLVCSFVTDSCAAGECSSDG